MASITMTIYALTHIECCSWQTPKQIPYLGSHQVKTRISNEKIIRAPQASLQRISACWIHAV